ncbi:TrbG/VirB9 family P-type conjugative transfer protein [Paraburkholderia unamae]|uniref:Uncharacterized protein n=1 Tax=Paraburkholderia unamae TaxID=219649 RepID=A0ABX5KUZ6_9BURK|nr:TrbG/VirB9 family P-type conjugative transfer protein [Paraburkholderia unamae]PVX85835.1 hypothetical protein C7402_103413 [Paraburkholderia unamae]
MKPTTTLAVALALALVFQHARASDTDPFDFDYDVLGGIAQRPALVFNDGSKTYIQPRPGQDLTADGGHREGPYVVVDGTPASVHYTVGGQGATTTWKRANAFIGGHGALPGTGDDQPAAFAGFSGHLSLIGAHGALEPVRTLDANLPIAQLVKSLVPQGWSGAAQKDVDLSAASRFATHPGENWMQALDRLMVQADLYADIDFDARRVRLHRDVGKSGALAYAGPAHDDGHPDVSATMAAPAHIDSQLARDFGANAIRDADDAHTQLRFNGKPARDLAFTTPEGGSLHPHWDAATSVMTIDRAPRFTVSDGTHRVEVARTAATVYDFAATNPAHLEAVFDQDGSTYFKFAPTVINVSVVDDRHLGSGEQKGRYYRFNGTSATFNVSADGQSVRVTRRHDVRYEETPAGAS